MARLINIPLGEDFLAQTARIISRLPCNYTVVLPNNRSCRELTRQCRRLDGILPRICSASDCVDLNQSEVMEIVIKALKDKYPEMPFLVLYDLADSLYALIVEFVLNCSEYDNLVVPKELRHYWDVTAVIFQSILLNKNITDIVTRAQNRVRTFYEKSENIALAGVTASNEMSRRLIKNVFNSASGIIVLHGLDSEIPYDNSQRDLFENVPRETNPDAKDADVTCCDEANQLDDHAASTRQTSADALSEANGKARFCGVNGNKYCQCLHSSHQSILGVLDNVPRETNLGTKGRSPLHYGYSEFLETSMSQSGLLPGNVPRETMHNIVEYVIAESSMDEAWYIALAVRKSLALDKSVMVVCPDAVLTRQIKQLLRRWDIVADSSTGDAFVHTPGGLLLLSVIEMIESGFSIDAVVNVLKHSDLIDEILTIEYELRHLQNQCGGFCEAVEQSGVAVSDELKSRIFAMRQLCCDMSARSVSEWMKLFVACSLCVDQTRAHAIQEKVSIEFSSLKLPFDECCLLLKKYLAGVTVSSATGYTPGVIIVGAIEGQLLHADVVVIAAANEESWTTSVQKTFWITKKMQAQLNIPPNDVTNKFFQCVFERLIHKPYVLVTRSDFVDGAAQQEYSMFTRFAHIMKRACWLEDIAKVSHISEKENFLFRPPTPPAETFPPRIFATEIENLFNNPYAFYAKKILKLKPIGHLEEQINLRGRFVHDLLEKAVADSSRSISESAQVLLAERNVHKAQFGMWFFRLKKIFHFVEANLPKCRSYPEIYGEIDLQTAPAHSIKIAARADRIDIDVNGVSIVDYKTGTVPTLEEVKQHIKPQLAVEALIALNDGFKAKNTSVVGLHFWKIDGKREGGAIHPVALSQSDIMQLAEGVETKLREAIENVRNSGYDISQESEYDKEYIHLSRIKECEG